jgi:tripartite-type tricarboxylate transporter receptor subunit TctC
MTRTCLSIVYRAVALAVVLLCGTQVKAAEDAASYPSRAIHIIVPFAPAGPNDILARLIADRLAAKWHVGVVVFNHPGGGTIIGTQIAARSAPDGYTLLMVSQSTATNISLKKSLPYDTLKDFTPVIRLADSPNVLVVNPKVPVRNVADLIALGKKQPGKISYGTGGIGTATDLAGRLLCISAGIKMINVPYKGDGPAALDLLSNRINWMFGTILPIMPYVRAKTLRPIAVSGIHRVDVLPDVPTVAETLPGFDARSFYGIFAPAGVPPAIAAKLNRAINSILTSDKVKDFLKQQGTTVVGGTPASFGTYFKGQVEKWGKVIKEAGIQPQ